MVKGVLRSSQISHRGPSQINEKPSQKYPAMATKISSSSTPHLLEYSKKSGVFLQWFALGVGCVERHACCSWSSYLTLRLSIANYLTALGCVFLVGEGEGVSDGEVGGGIGGGVGGGGAIGGLERVAELRDGIIDLGELGRSALLHCLSMFTDDRLTVQGIAYPSYPLSTPSPPAPPTTLPSPPTTLLTALSSPPGLSREEEVLTPLLTNQPFLQGSAHTAVPVPYHLSQALKTIAPTLTATAPAIPPATTATTTVFNRHSYPQSNPQSHLPSNPIDECPMFFCCLNDEEALVCATVLVKLLPVKLLHVGEVTAVMEKSKSKGETIMGRGMGEEVKRGVGTGAEAGAETMKKRGRAGDILRDEESRRDEAMKDEIVQCVEGLLSPIINRPMNDQSTPQDNHKHLSTTNDHGVVTNNTTTTTTTTTTNNNNNTNHEQKKKKIGSNTKSKAIRLLAKLRATLLSSQISQSK